MKSVTIKSPPSLKCWLLDSIGRTSSLEVDVETTLLVECIMEKSVRIIHHDSAMTMKEWRLVLDCRKAWCLTMMSPVQQEVLFTYLHTRLHIGTTQLVPPTSHNVRLRQLLSSIPLETPISPLQMTRLLVLFPLTALRLLYRSLNP